MKFACLRTFNRLIQFLVWVTTAHSLISLLSERLIIRKGNAAVSDQDCIYSMLKNQTEFAKIVLNRRWLSHDQ